MSTLHQWENTENQTAASKKTPWSRQLLFRINKKWNVSDKNNTTFLNFKMPYQKVKNIPRQLANFVMLVWQRSFLLCEFKCAFFRYWYETFFKLALVSRCGFGKTHRLMKYSHSDCPTSQKVPVVIGPQTFSFLQGFSARFLEGLA